MRRETNDNGAACQCSVSKTVWIMTVILILVFLLTGIFVKFFLSENISRLVLVALIVSMAILGGTVIAVFYFRKPKKEPNVRLSARNTANVGNTRNSAGNSGNNGYRYQPTAPPPSSSKSSWNYTRNYSERNTMLA